MVDKQTIELGKGVSLDLQALVTGRTFLSAVTRFGKSWTCRRIAELLFGKCLLIIIDPESEYSTLREKYPFLIIGKDVEVVPETAEYLVDQILANDISTIIDLGDPKLDILTSQEFVAKFIERLIAVQTQIRKPTLIIIEEADEFCLTPDTEILTSEGWKKYNDIHEGDLVLTLNTKTSTLEYQPIKRVIIKPHSGHMITIKSKTIDAKLTPEHRVLLQTYDHGKYGPWYWKNDYEFRPAACLPKSGFRIPATGVFNGEEVPISDDVIRLIGWIITEGWLHKTHGGRYQHLEIEQSVKNRKNIEEIRNILKRLGIRYSEYSRYRVHQYKGKKIRSRSITFYLNMADCARVGVLRLLKNSIHEIPKVLLNASARQMRLLYETLMKGDGTKQRYLTRLGRKFRERKSVFYAGTNYRLADQFQELCLKLNIRAIISGNNPRNIRVCVSERYPYHYIKKRNILLSNYKGLTWDITVPNGTFVARRNGRPFITGNCPEKGTFKSVSKQAILKLAKKGGKRGLGAIFVTQRPAFLSKYAISQCVNKIIGHMEWPSDLKVIQDFLRVPKPIVDKISQLEQGCFYVAGEFVDKQGFVKVGPVQTKHLGATPEVVPPAPAELERVVSRMREELPKIIEEKLAPAVPKVSEIEAKVREKLEAAYLAKLQRLEKEREALKKKLEAKFEAEKAELCKRYETEIAELRKKYEEAVRQATLKGRTTDLLSHPLVQRNLAKLNDKERHLIEILETKGPQDANRIAFALGVSPSYVPTFVYKINEKIPNLVRSVDGKYVSMLARLFPVTEELQAEARESERLRAEVEKLRVELDRLRTLAKDLSEKLANAMTENNQLRGALKLKTEEVMKLMARVRELENRIKEIETAKPVPIAVRTEPAVEQTVPKQPTVVAPPEQVVPVEVRLKRVVTDVSITTDKEVLEADEKTMIGKILARGLEGFFDQPRTLGEVMKELERRYALSSSSGGTRQSATNALEELVSKGILDRREENGQWVYFATPSFRERVKGK